MKQASHRLTEASKGIYGKDVAANILERINWVTSEVEGEHVLDVGCNQGKVSIILAKAGKKVIGVDISDQAIDDARQERENQPDKVKQNVSFQKVNILEDELKENDFDTVILSEVLEQYESVEPILKKVSHLLKEQGKVIVTVPFGINEYSDQKKTYYFQDIYQEVKKYFKVEEIEFAGSSVGLVGTLNPSKNRGPVPVRFIQRLEKAFYQLEKKLRDENTDQEEMIKTLKNEKDRMEQELHSIKKTVNSSDRSDYYQETSSEDSGAHDKVEELLEVNQILKDQLEKSNELNKRWENEVKQLHEKNTELNQKWTERFNDLKKQTESLISRYKKQIEKLKKRK